MHGTSKLELSLANYADANYSGKGAVICSQPVYVYPKCIERSDKLSLLILPTLYFYYRKRSDNLSLLLVNSYVKIIASSFDVELVRSISKTEVNPYWKNQQM